jgi:hypothetical protein
MASTALSNMKEQVSSLRSTLSKKNEAVRSAPMKAAVQAVPLTVAGGAAAGAARAALGETLFGVLPTDIGLSLLLFGLGAGAGSTMAMNAAGGAAASAAGRLTEQAARNFMTKREG